MKPNSNAPRSAWLPNYQQEWLDERKEEFNFSENVRVWLDPILAGAPALKRKLTADGLYELDKPSGLWWQCPQCKAQFDHLGTAKAHLLKRHGEDA